MGGEHSLQAQDARRTLGVGTDIDADALRRAYLAAVKTSHPDLAGGDVARLRAVIDAYALLKPAAFTRPVAAPPPAPMPEALVLTPAQAVLGGSATVSLAGGRRVKAALPAGLRHGDRVRIDGRRLVVTVRPEAGTSVLGDHLCLTLEVDRALLSHGGRVTVQTPSGAQRVWISRAAAHQGFVRLAGLGLPARGVHRQGHLFVRLRAAESSPAERASRDLLRRFAAAWAA